MLKYTIYASDEQMSFKHPVFLLKLLALGGLLYVVINVFTGDLSTRARRYSEYGEDSDQFRNEIPVQWQDMCQFLERPLEGVDGPVDNSSLRLKGLAVVFRHGERSPIFEEADDDSCSPVREVDRRAFEEYRKAIFNEDFEYFLRIDQQFKDFPRVPHRSRCSSGELTAEGALQHLRLGRFMNQKYGKSSLFSAENQLDLSLTSSIYHRTFQSLLAFSRGFLFPHKSSLPQVFVKASKHSFQCTHEACNCPIARDWRHTHENELLGVFRSSAKAVVRDKVDNLRVLSSFRSAKDPFQVMDVALGRYVCRRRPLPCADHGCLTYDFLSELLNYTTARSSYVYSHNDEFIARKLQLVEAYGVLYHLQEAISRINRFPHTNQIKIFSGHDVIVGPLLRVLGVPFVDFPRYVSRVVFEIYGSNSDASSDILVRVIYNGVDVTDKVLICKTLVNGLCPAQYFDKFVHEDLFEMLGTKSIHNLCRP